MGSWEFLGRRRDDADGVLGKDGAWERCVLLGTIQTGVSRGTIGVPAQ